MHYQRQRRHNDLSHTYPTRETVCSMSACDRKYYGRGYCFMHYKRNKKFGDPTVVKVNRQRESGISKSPEYRTWIGIKNRCYNTNEPAYPYYGGRGIAVSDEWHNFDNFIRDMGQKPKSLTLERIDNNKGYSKENCKWATRETQANNRRNNRLFTFNGETKTISQWAKYVGMSPPFVFNRIHKGWSEERALGL